MAGLYVHIPFCKKRCLYCDFFSTTLLNRRAEYVDAILIEIKERKNEIHEPIRTVYLGGGTPSTLDINDITRILNAVDAPDTEEITMELNPGDATFEYIRALRQIGINRLSIGVQSFQDELLQCIGRRHTAQQAIEAVRIAQEAGFDNLSIDLMYGLPNQTMAQWQADIRTAIQLGVQHISSYGLMYEPGTVLTQQLESGQLTAMDEDEEMTMYDILCEQLKHAGFVHYEVSNFALPGYEAKHNSNYWNGTPYVGIGAGAHSYTGNVRSWNPDDLDAYIRGIVAHDLQRESETLTETDIYNERIMLGLRTKHGVPKEWIQTDISTHVEAELLREDHGRVIATQEGLHILNRIIEDLMI